MTTILPDTTPQDTTAEQPDTRAWINTAFHGMLEAKYFENVKRVALQDEDRALSIHLTPAVAAALAVQLIDAAADAGYDTAVEADRIAEIAEDQHRCVMTLDEVRAVVAEAHARRELDAMGPVRDFADVKHELDL